MRLSLFHFKDEEIDLMTFNNFGNSQLAINNHEYNKT